MTTLLFLPPPNTFRRGSVRLPPTRQTRTTVSCDLLIENTWRGLIPYSARNERRLDTPREGTQDAHGITSYIQRSLTALHARALTVSRASEQGQRFCPPKQEKLQQLGAGTTSFTRALTVLRKQGEDFPLELELVHGKPSAAEAHGRLQDVHVDRQPNNRPERMRHAIALVVEVLQKERGWNNSQPPRVIQSICCIFLVVVAKGGIAVAGSRGEPRRRTNVDFDARGVPHPPLLISTQVSIKYLVDFENVLVKQDTI